MGSINSDKFVNSFTDKEVEKFWDSVADIYVEENDKVSDTHDQRFEFASEYLDLSSEQDILNVTSRDCGAVKFFGTAEARFTNAEISSKLMEVARTLTPEAVQVKLDSYSNLPFADASFDSILCLETLEHVHNPVKFLSELYRVSKPNSTMVLSCPPQTSEIPYQIYTFLFAGHGEGPHRFPSSRDVKEMLMLSNWRLTIHRPTVLVPVGPKWLRKLGEKILHKYSALSELGIRHFYVCKK